MSKKKNTKPSNSVILGIGAAGVTTAILTTLSYQIFKTEPIVVAARDIEAFQEQPLTETDFKIIHVSSRNKKDFNGFADSISSLVGTIPKTDIVSNQPVKRSQFIDPNNAEEIQNVVSSQENRSLYLPVSSENVLFGDLKVGSSVDLFIKTTKPNPTVADPNNEEEILIPFQMSFRVTKMKVLSDSEYLVFFDFPMEESEQYIMLKELIDSDNAEIIATMPNIIHKPYDGITITNEEFKNSLLSTSNYFSKLNKEDFSEEGKVNVSIDEIKPNSIESQDNGTDEIKN